MIRVMIVHQSPLFRLGLRAVLERQRDVEIVGETVLMEDLLKLRASTSPHAILFDGSLTSCLPSRSAAHVVAELHSTGAHGIFVFAPSTEEEDFFRFLQSGAAAYELPTISGDHLVEKIRRVAAGEYLMESDVLQSAHQRQGQRLPLMRVPRLCMYEETSTRWPKHSRAFVQGRDTSKIPGMEHKTPTSSDIPVHYPSVLSSRELMVLQQILKGFISYEAIGRMLEISDGTVRQHCGSIYKKLDAHNRTHAVVIALRRRLISFDDV